MSKLTVKLREWASRGSFDGTVTIKTTELLKLIGVIEEYELQDTDIVELKTKIVTYHINSIDHQQKISDIRGLPKYMFNKIHGVEKTPVGDYISVEDINNLIDNI